MSRLKLLRKLETKAKASTRALKLLPSLHVPEDHIYCSLEMARYVVESLWAVQYLLDMAEAVNRDDLAAAKKALAEMEGAT